MRVTVLGGGGSVGSIASKVLSSVDIFSEVVIGDINLENAKNISANLNKDKVSALYVDAYDIDSIKNAIKGSSVVLNCIGPFYEFGPRILRAVIETGTNYVDVCDDFDATELLLAMNNDAKRANISALIGMGSSPGLANVLVCLCADYLLDEVDSIDIYHAHGGEEREGRAVVKHRIHSMMIDIPVFLDGRPQTVRLFEENGRALEEDVYFPELGRFKVYAYPHPETITLPKYIKGVKRVTNLGLVLPPAYAELIKGVVRLGMTDEEPINVLEQKVSPLEFAVSFILSQRDKLLKDAGITGPMGCLKIVVNGKKDGKKEGYIFSLASKGKGMGEGTGIPAAIGTILMAQGKITERGVLPPEACINPMDVLEIAPEAMKLAGGGGEKEKFPLTVERVDAEGNIKKIGLDSFGL